MDLNVKLTCLDSGKTECIIVTLDEWDHMCVKDLKKTLEDEIQVPVCDQKLSYQDLQLNDDLFPLKKLYFRQGDTVSVSCSTQGDILNIVNHNNIDSFFVCAMPINIIKELCN